MKKLIPFLEPRVANDNYQIVLGSTRGAGLEISAQSYSVSREGVPIERNIIINNGIERIERTARRAQYSRNPIVGILGGIAGSYAESQKRAEKFDVAFEKVDITARLWDQTRFQGADIELDAIIYELHIWYDQYGRVAHIQIAGAVDAVTGETIPEEMPDQDYTTKAFADFSLKLFAAELVLKRLFPL